VGALARADAKNETGLLVATDKRLFFLNTESGSYFIKHTDVVEFHYDDVEQMTFDIDGVLITRRDAASTGGRRTALTRVAFGGLVGGGIASLVPASVSGTFLFLFGALVGGAAVAAAQRVTRNRRDAVPGWIRDLSGNDSQGTFRLDTIPPREAGAVYDYLGSTGGPLEGRITDLSDVRTRAAMAAADETGKTGEPERWAVASIALGAAVASASVLAFLVGASAADYCEAQPWWLFAILAGPLLGSVLVAVGFWGTRSPRLRNRAGWVWALIAASFFLTWIALPASC
jgi:hypothetical protein